MSSLAMFLHLSEFGDNLAMYSHQILLHLTPEYKALLFEDLIMLIWFVPLPNQLLANLPFVIAFLLS
jgi:hypothetical protein